MRERRFGHLTERELRNCQLSCVKSQRVHGVYISSRFQDACVASVCARHTQAQKPASTRPLSEATLNVSTVA